MSSVRQLGSGLLYAAISVVLVVGGLSLGLAEGVVKPAPPPTTQPSPTLLPPTPTEAPPSPTSALPPSVTPLVVVPSATNNSLPPTATLRAVATSTSAAVFHATVASCGPYAGWVHNYFVKAGDTLFHISTLFRTTVIALQVANCLRSDLIIPGEQLWVPNVPTSTPGVTLIPTFPTSTPVPTEPLTLTPIPYFTETAEPSPTDTPGG